MTTKTEPFAAHVRSLQQRAEAVLDRTLSQADAPTARLLEAMRYSVLGGGKRLRPLLVYCTGEAFGAPLDALDAPAAAVEIIHAYSLVHDDLPAMDDDDLRRGRPTCHKVYGEGTAVLVGDALQAYAFEVLAEDPASTLTDSARLACLRVLAQGIGTLGMAGGQAIDLDSVGQRLDLASLETMHRRKTGALIRASVLMGAIAAQVTDPATLAALRVYGDEMGLAFQIQDDILDVAGDAATLGKATGADAARDKPTYPSLLGLGAARERADWHRDRALASLASLGKPAESLEALARFVVDRRT
ncbi:MAG: (2E,6E)-farnesyl diphosphate synthase [Steroidobacteraceae bacterium]